MYLFGKTETYINFQSNKTTFVSFNRLRFSYSSRYSHAGNSFIGQPVICIQSTTLIIKCEDVAALDKTYSY